MDECKVEEGRDGVDKHGSSFEGFNTNDNN